MGILKNIQQNRDYFIKKAQLEKELRQWFDQHGFLELTTPVILSHSSLEENIVPLSLTLHNPDRSKTGYLRVSPELSLKKILAYGLPKIYELGPCFRDLENSTSPQHLNEFTLLEWYHAGINLKEMMDELITLISSLATAVHGYPMIITQGQEINISPCSDNWKIISIAECFRNYAGIDFSTWSNWEEILLEAKKRGFKTSSLNDAFYWLFLNLIEPQIRNKPCIIYEYPIFQASFSQGVFRPTKNNPCGLEYGLRFEAYLGGMEICNAFQELVDHEEQRRRWQAYLDKGQGDRDYGGMDEDFLLALAQLQDNYQKKSTPISGIALGWERLLMCLLGRDNIRDIQPFYFDLLR